MAIGFKDANEPATTSTSELPVYQTASEVTEAESSTNITSHSLELAVSDSATRPERSEYDSSLKNTNHKSEVNSGVISVKIAEMVFNIISFITVRESPFANSTPGICFSLVSSLGFTITGCLLGLYACGAFKKPCIKVLPFEYVFCILWGCAFLAASSFLANSSGLFEGEPGKAPIYGFASMILYCIEACLNCRVMVKRNTESKGKRESIKVCDNCRGWNQPASEAYNRTDSSVNNNDPNDHWTRFYDLNAISDGCIIIF